jgi:hypothetical protein
MALDERGFRRALTRDLGADIVISAVLPWVTVLALARAGVPLVTAFAIAAIFPLVRGIVSLLRRHRLDAIGAINLAFLAASIAVTFVTGDVHFVLLRGVLATGGFGLLCLGSLFARRPLMFYLARQLLGRGDPEAEAAFDARWQFRPFRRAMRLITFGWGAAFAVEVVLRVIVAYRLTPVQALAAAPFITYGTLALLIAWTVAYSSAVRRKYAATQPAAAA